GFLPFLEGRGSAIVEAGRFDWDHEQTISTLPGAPPQTTTDSHKVPYAGIGARLYFPLWVTALPVGISGGTSFGGTDKTNYFAAQTGLEYAFERVRVAFDVRYQRFTKISQREVTFNPFGPAQVTESHSAQSFLTFNARFSFR